MIYCFDFVFNSIANICVFFSSVLFSLTESSKIKYLLPFFFKITIYVINKLIQRIYTVNIFAMTNFFYCNIANVVNAFCLLLTSLSQKFWDWSCRCKNSMFDFWCLFAGIFSLMSSLNCCLSMGTKINTTNAFFNYRWFKYLQ